MRIAPCGCPRRDSFLLGQRLYVAGPAPDPLQRTLLLINDNAIALIDLAKYKGRLLDIFRLNL